MPQRQPLDLQPLDLQPFRPETVTPPPLPPAEPSFLESVYRGVFDAPSFITEPATKFAESMMPGLDTEWPRLRGFIGGAAEGAASLLSPANILTAGKGRLPQLAAKILGGTQALHGGAELAEGNIAEGVGDIGFGMLSGISGMQRPRPGLATVGEGIRTPEAPITPESFGPDFWRTPAEPITPEMGRTIRHGLESKPKTMVGETLDIQPIPKPTMETAPMGQTILIRKEGATPENIKRAKEAGFEFLGLNDQGNFRFRKTQQPTAQPILESEIGTARPTRSVLGPTTDVKKSSVVAEAFNLTRGLKASMDFSAPLRQGITLIHKPEFWTSVKPMLKAWASEGAFRQNQIDIANRPLFRKRAGEKGKILPSFADDAGLKLTDLTDLSRREEAIMSTWAEKVPGVRRSNRAYTAFLNNLRADTFESLVRDGKIFGADAKANLPLARALADFVNTASGRGSLGKLESSAVALNTMLFSPRLIASRLKLLNPAYYIMAPPQVRKEALKSLAALTVVGNTIGQLGRMAGGEVSSDPSSSDFGKLKIGDTRIDPFGGFQQYVVAFNRLLNPAGPVTGFRGDTPLTRGQMVTSTGSGREYDLWNPQGPYDPTLSSVAGRFGRGKLHPTIEFAYSIASGMKDITGKPLNFQTMNPMENALTQQFIPILAQDVYELSQTNPELLPIAAPLATFGMGVQSYGP